MQAMPVLDALLSGAPYTHESDMSVDPISPSFKSKLKSAVRVMAPDEIADGWLSSSDLPTPDQIGPQKMPFDSMWVERSAPGLVIGGEVRKGKVHIGQYLTKYEDGGESGYLTETFLMSEGKIARRRYSFLVTTDEDGAITRSGPVPKSTDPLAMGGDANLASLYASQASTEYLYGQLAVMLTLGLMNCKNVHLVENRPPAKFAGKGKRRKRIPALSFHTIKLPSHGGGGSGRSASGESVNLAKHKVRGHFKTYTAERPLMGRHVGTYWWGWQVRGNAQNGVVVSDYKVGRPAA